MQYIDHKDITKQDFFKKTGLKRGFLDADKLNASVTDIFIAKIIAAFPELNIEWLITGLGEMTKSTRQYDTADNDFSLAYEPKMEYQTVPLYDIEAYAGLVPLFKNGVEKPLEHISIPGIPKCDGAVHVTGDSMYPLLKSGDIVLYKKINNIKDNIFFGEMYLISVDMDGEEYVAVKYINKSELKDHIKLVSYNQYHAERDIPLEKVRALAFIKASIRINSMN
ncbi:S24 family peptidase [Saccharicrinis fermentans]|uniref:S24 family peptidase n=1 Tax=Saccharicrinis fermentans TaxID=982 RepID=UPI0004B16D01|nr:S24 family peptidase [Saccharicrinis fermentans]